MWRYHLILQFTVFIWGFTGILGELITLDQQALVWYRMLIAFLSLLIFLLIQRPTHSFFGKDTAMLFLTGGIIAAHWVFFFGAIKVSTVSVAVVCMATQSVFISILQPLFKKTPIIWYELILGLIAMLGIALIYGVETQHALGIFYGLLSSFFASLFTLLNADFTKRLNTIYISTLEMLGGVLFLTAYLGVSGSFHSHWFDISSSDLGYLLLLGVVCTAAAFAVSVWVMKQLTAFTVSISVNLEPIYTIVLALLFFGSKEQMSIGFYLGAIIIFCTVIINAWLKVRSKRKRQQHILDHEMV